MEEHLGKKTVDEFVNMISDQYRVMSGAVIAISAAQAAALGEACVQISLENQLDKLDWQETTVCIEQLTRIKSHLVKWCNVAANIATDQIKYEGTDIVFQEYLYLCDVPSATARLSLEAVQLLQEFEPKAIDLVHDDLCISIHLLVEAAQAATRLLTTRLQAWSGIPLPDKYATLQENLTGQLHQFQNGRLRVDAEMGIAE